MKVRFIDLFVGSVAISFAFAGFMASRGSFHKDRFYSLDRPIEGWSFTTDHGYLVGPLYSDLHIAPKVPNSEPCCNGVYRAQFSLADPLLKAQLESKDIGMLFPNIGGLKEIRINGHPIEVHSQDSFCYVGPVIHLSHLNLDKIDSTLNIEVRIQSTRHFFAGMIKGPPVLGPLVALEQFRIERAGYLQTLPFSFAIVYFSLTILFVWLAVRVGTEGTLYKEYIECLLLYSIFYLFLSGLPRRWDPVWGSILHFPANLLATGSVFSLIGSFGRMPSLLLNRFRWGYRSFAALSVVLGVLNYPALQVFLSFIGRLAVIYPMYVLEKNRKTALQNLIFIVAAFVSISFVNDAFRSLAEATSYPYPFDYMNRYTTPFLLLTSLIYLVTQLTDAVAASSRRNTLYELSAQVAHDIRSPLAALETVITHLQGIPENEKMIVKSATYRIREIAQKLLSRNRKEDFHMKTEQDLQEEKSNQVLTALVENIITEKRVQINHPIYFKIDSHEQNSYGFFSCVQPVEFRRVISNIIDNAIEALQPAGQIDVLLAKTHQEITIQIQDNGKGIPSHVLSRLGEKGVTYGKEGGSGLGLYHAKRMLQSWSGRLKIESQEGVGTKVSLVLPHAATPNWFVPKIRLIPGSTIILLDDDRTVHSIWESRFESMRASSYQITSQYFANADDLIAWHRQQKEDAPITYLVDYQLADQPWNGLDVIENLQIQQNSILVTHSFEDPKIIERCTQMDVGLVPKNLISWIPLTVGTKKERPDAILIDDDHLVRLTWKVAAKSQKKVLLAFATPQEFIDQMQIFDFDTPLYIDSKLGNGIKGEEIALELYKQGFNQIYLATGYESQNFKPMSWIRAIVGKEPIWGKV